MELDNRLMIFLGEHAYIDSQSMSTESCNNACIQTDIIVSQTEASAGNIEEIRALQDIQSRIILLQTVLNVHYSLLVNASIEQKMVHVSIFEAMTEPMRCILELILENLKNESNQCGAFMTTWNDLHRMVAQFTEKYNDLQEQHEVVFVSGGKPTYVPDTNSFLHHHNAMSKLMKEAESQTCFVAIPQKVISELDGLTKNEHYTVQMKARCGLRLLNQFKDVVIKQRFLEYFDDAWHYQRACCNFFKHHLLQS